eukprot:m.502651 g.502651  ORF g.502651 m.502651 type:complete len:56 (-) comp21843_c0_seq12:1870-2037(-)
MVWEHTHMFCVALLGTPFVRKPRYHGAKSLFMGLQPFAECALFMKALIMPFSELF